MRVLLFPTLLLLGHAALQGAPDPADKPLSLESAREIGRQKSRFLKNSSTETKPLEATNTANTADFEKKVHPVLAKNCTGCHGPKKAEGRLRIDQLNADLLKGPDAEKWREVYNALIKAEMPPEDAPNEKLTDTERGQLVDWLGDELHKASMTRRASKEHSSFRRLTKYEYNYALQDLLGLNAPFASKLPPETVSEDGFKNRSDLLQISAMQFQTYREIGLQALRRAVVIGDQPRPVTYIIPMVDQLAKAARQKNPKTFDDAEAPPPKPRLEQHLLDRSNGRGVLQPQGQALPKENAVFGMTPPVSPVVWVIPPGSEIKINLDRFLPDEGTMRVRIRAGRSTMHPDEFAHLRLAWSAHTSNNANFYQPISAGDVPVTASQDDPQFIHFDIPLSDIQRNPFRKLETAFPRRDEFLHIRNVASGAGRERLDVLIDHIEITAPFYEQWPPKSHTALFFDSRSKGDEHAYGRELLGNFLRRVWRRPVQPQEVDAFLNLFGKYRSSLPTFEDAMVEVFATALASPEFLYLTPKQAPSGGESSRKRIDPFELASRIALFLWSSIPDEKLLQLAEGGKLREPAVLSAEVERMLADPRSKRLSGNFVDQWLGLDRIQSVSHIKDDNLRETLLQEPVALFEDVLQRNGSILDFLDCDYAFLNQRLAAMYGISTPTVYGPDFRKVAISPRSNRGGMLTAAAMLAINSDGKDSHPVKRGVWLLQRILHDPPPPPPPNVPEVDLTDPEILKMTLKERIVNHRNQAACASCHARIDPWGIAFENYDAMGVYRTQVNGRPVDATSDLFNKQTLSGIEGLKRYLLTERQDQFAEALVHKLTAYALGRPLTLGDRIDIERITAQFRQRNDRLKDLIQLIVSSDLFNARD